MPETLAAATVAATLTAASERLREAGCDTPRLDAELLLASVLGCDRAALLIRRHEDVDTREFEALLARRAAREPVAYILRRKEFRRISLTVDQRVLIPRPETELLVEVGLSLPTGARVVDVGTGSGAVALAVKHERPDLDVIGTDVSEAALEVARGNATRLGLSVRFVHGDLLADVPCDAVLANLPYVAEGEELPPEITGFEPAGALFAGPDGLELIRRLLRMVAEVALVALEVGAATTANAGQAPAVSTLLQRAGFRSIDVLSDLAGHDRVIVGRR